MKELGELILNILVTAVIGALVAWGTFCLLAVLREKAARIRRGIASLTLWRLPRMTIAVLMGGAIVTVNIAQKGDRGSGGSGVPSIPSQQTGTTGDSPVEDITDTFHFSAISVPTSGTVTLTTAWTNGLLTAGQTIDILVKTDLRDEA